MGLHVRFLGLGLFTALWPAAIAEARTARPNVLLIITDDQGYGDLGFHGNPVIRTPVLDRLARASVRLERFYVSPVCAPTRASLLTGRYAYRTGVVDTFLGRALMHPDEVTLAELFSASGYRTALFGKWHLGDNYPLRAIDQGFQEAMVLRGGGIGQPSDPPEPGGDRYFDPILQHNGRELKTRGYCSDIFTDAAIDFIRRAKDRPFFVNLAFNAPHTPLQVPENDEAHYKSVDLSARAFPKRGQPLPAALDPSATAKVYAMVSNIDRNLGRLFSALEELGLGDDTIVVFLTDNGPQQARYNAGLRDRKGSVYEGGIRVPCFVRWPGTLRAGGVVDRIASAIDLAPTLLECCGVPKPPGVVFDGRSLLPLLKGGPTPWEDRTLYFQWHRGDVPVRFRSFAARSQRYKLLRPESSTPLSLETSFELYDLEHDPFERENLAGQLPEIVERLRAGYESWFEEVGRARGFAPVRIVLGAAEEPRSLLTRQDWRGPRAGWNPDDLGHWEVAIAREGRLRVTLRFPARPVPTRAHLALAGVALDLEVSSGSQECQFDSIRPRPGPSRLEAWVASDGRTTGVSYVAVERLD